MFMIIYICYSIDCGIYIAALMCVEVTSTFFYYFSVIAHIPRNLSLTIAHACDLNEATHFSVFSKLNLSRTGMPIHTLYIC